MSVEAITGSSDENDLNVVWPADTDFFSEGAAHIRNLKIVLQNLFEDGKANTAAAADLATNSNALSGKALAAFFLAEVSDVVATNLDSVILNAINRWNASTTNKPGADNGVVFTFIASTKYIGQIGLSSSGVLYYRTKDVVGASWSSWTTPSTSANIDGTDINPSRVRVASTEVIGTDAKIDWGRLKNVPTIGTVTGVAANNVTTSGSGNIANPSTQTLEMSGNNIRLRVNTHYTDCNCVCVCDCTS